MHEQMNGKESNTHLLHRIDSQRKSDVWSMSNRQLRTKFTIKLFSKNGKKKKDFLLYLPIVRNPKFQEESPEEKRRGVSCYEPLPFTRFSALFWTYNSELPPCYYYYYILSKAPDLGYSQGLFLLVSRVLYLPWKQPSMALENMKIKEKEIENEGAKREHSFNFCWDGEILGCGPTFIRTHRHGIIILFCGPTTRYPLGFVPVQLRSVTSFTSTVRKGPVTVLRYRLCLRGWLNSDLLLF